MVSYIQKLDSFFFPVIDGSCYLYHSKFGIYSQGLNKAEKISNQEEWKKKHLRIVAEMAEILIQEELSFREMMHAVSNLFMSLCYHYDISDEHLRQILQKLLTDYREENYEVEQ